MKPGLAEGEVLLGRFTLSYALDRAGPSQTWVAEDAELLAEVVLRVLDPGLSDHTARERMRAACRRVRRLHHPNIVPAFDFHRDRAFCFVSRAFVEGRNVAVLVGQPAPVLIGSLVQALDALEYAHARGIAHGDLKETKLLVDPSGNVQIADFLMSGASLASAEEAAPSESEAEDLAALGVTWLRVMTGSSAEPRGLDDAAARLSGAGLGTEAADAIARLALPSPQGEPRDPRAIRQALSRAIEESGRRASLHEQEPQPGRERLFVPVRTPEQVRTAPERFPERGFGVALAILVAIVLGVFFWLPRVVSDPEPVELASEAPRLETEDPTEVDERRGGAPADPRKLLGTALNRLEGLQKRGAAEWSPEELARAEEAIASGERAGGGADAAEHYRRALESLDEAEARSLVVLEEALRKAGSLDASDSSEALRLYELALRIDRANPTATEGARRIRAARVVADSIREGQRLEGQGNLRAARSAYARALASDPDSAETRAAVERLDAQLAASAYSSHMARAMTALGKDDLGAAEAEVKSALAVRADSPEALDLRRRIEQKRLAVAIQRARARAESLEGAERWDEAAKEYRQLLAMDATLAFATEGFERSERMASAVERFDAWIAKPSLLFDNRTRKEAAELLDLAKQSPHQGPRLQKQIQTVSAIAEAASTPIPVVFESDGSTEVKIQRHGTIGTFVRREVALKPGTYVVRGIRRSFRDVRQTVTVLPGAETQTVVVSCREEI